MISKTHQTLPAWTYTSDAFLKLEKRHLFLNNWQLICHSSNIPNAGDYFTFNFFNERLVAIRNENDDINVFHNVCSHRATKLLGMMGIAVKELDVLIMHGVMTYPVTLNLFLMKSNLRTLIKKITT